MAVARHFFMNAAESKAEALEAALRNLADTLREIPGCEGVELLQDIDDSRVCVFIEKWASVEAHKEGSKRLTQDDLAPLIGALESLPREGYFAYLKTV